ncbi:MULTISPECIES: DUF456 domain-containing protein [Streptomyces]|uniref:DUF456 domain-containing protein n=2 Tax=Streptomyces TaxID=1883 RepID=A0A124EC61_9ACTN|nr:MULTISPECIES: DUF456 domain-containing protein [Streptomyces]KUH36621.1 hypothetical protein ATE80_22735 [Streptomyces kanasensis]UUS33573.1 DUF456 domain-containing protein [Streptomyces changanensis]
MGVWQQLLVALVLLLGLVGVLAPGVAGSWLVWAGVAWWSLQVATAAAWWLFAGSTVLMLVTHVVVGRLPPRRLRGVGVTRRMVVYAGVGALLGFVLVPVVGGVPGYVAGVYLAARRRHGGHRRAVAATRLAMRAIGTSVLVELYASLLVVAAWLGVLVGT